MNFLAAVKTASFAERLLKAAGLDLAQLAAAGDDSALAAHIEQLATSARQSAPAPAQITAEHPEVAALISAHVTAALAAQAAELSAAAEPFRAQATILAAGLGALGIAPKAADEAKGLQSADVSAALKAYAAKEARALLAAKGFSAAPLADEPAADPAKPAAPKVASGLTGLARAIAAHRAAAAL